MPKSELPGQSTPESEKVNQPKYHSLFDRIDFTSGENLAYDGTLRHVIDELREELQTNSFTKDSLFKRVLHPPRIIRAVLDDKIRNPVATSTELICQAIQVGLAVYAGSDEAESKLGDFEASLSGADKEYVLDLPLQQITDKTTYMAMNPIYSRKSSSMLAEYTGGKPILFIPLAHGAVGVGMDIFLRYCDKVEGNGESIFYPVRNSHHKKNDRGPKITDEEKKFLQDVYTGRVVVIFDQSVNTGQTLEDTTDYFTSTVFNTKPVTLTNSNQWNLAEINVRKIDLSFLSDM
jgi:hypothetical protein